MHYGPAPRRCRTSSIDGGDRLITTDVLDAPEATEDMRLRGPGEAEEGQADALSG